jgi:two-component sensor histidine kinase
LVALSGLPNLETRGLRWALKTIGADDKPGTAFAQSPAGTPFDAVDIQVTTPFAGWILTLGTSEPNAHKERLAISLIAAGAAAFAAWLIDAYILKAHALAEEVRERRNAERRLAASLAEKETLMRETHHRIKNNLAIIESIVSLQSDEAVGTRFEDSFAQLAKRVHSITLIHEKLYRSDRMDRVAAAPYIRELVRHITASMGCGGEEVVVKVADIELNARTALPVGLLLTELCTNALKYGCESGLKVSLAQTDDLLALTVEDDGPPPPEDFRDGCGLGLRLVDSLSAQISGSWRVDRGPPVRFIVEFPSSLALPET